MATAITQDGDILQGTLSQIELGMIRAAALGPDDILVIQWPKEVADPEYERIRRYLKQAIPDRRVVLVGPGVVFGILDTDPDHGISQEARNAIDAIAEAERILTDTVRELQEAVTWAEREIARLDMRG